LKWLHRINGRYGEKSPQAGHGRELPLNSAAIRNDSFLEF
jgi:hypothetical protein